MPLPSWWSWQGLGLHFFAGTLLTIILGITGCSNPAVLVGVVAVAIAHEQAWNGQTFFSDFHRANGGPWNGVLDVATFAITPALFLWWGW
jgi:hypothetical protein